ncbi:Heat shock protein DnaJ N-terminal [Penicillium hispanicum]|uniref:Heat shock protein DnaJ N-terminal n=1 Tax=Penicillium hispanicum TaxID=1080232 RepID=UPI0025401BF6|nr:Heat shock protein DnaJ N-terminal [Penicillium hispanicum]KAJ5578611.1 Heat shock protein DnaJ N-terminal [Penicillium hispanicum]
MVKADVRRDYYADLGLGPSAEAEDIKKQFRKLALKYHPDRNPGKEQEFNAKFQAIQAAHEILSDPQQRLKYDTDRLRAGYGKVYGPPKTNPRRTQPFTPTPPSKPQAPKPPFARANTTSNGPSSGAQRYATHARAGPQQWQKADEAQTRADAFRGFSGMRGSNAGAWRSFDPQTGYANATPGATPRQQNTPFGNPRPKSAYEYFKENVKTQNPTSPNSPKKRHGFAPGTAGGDEPMAANTSAYNNYRSERPSSMYFESAPPPTAKKPPVAPDPPPVTPEFERQSSRYATSGGEKTKLGRSSTIRTPSGSYGASNARTNPSSPVYDKPERHRSASPKARRNPAYSPSPDTSSSDPDDTDEELFRPNPFKPKAVPKSRLRPHQKFADFHRKDDSSPGTGEDPPTRPSAQWFQHAAPTLDEGSRRPRQPPVHYVDLTADSDDHKGHNSDSAAFTRGSNRPQQPDQFQGSTSRYENYFVTLYGSSNLYLFRSHFASKPTDPQSSTFKHRSSSDVNNLHKKFSAEDWRDHINQFDFLGAAAAEKELLRRSPNYHNRSRTAGRNDPAQPAASAGAPGANPLMSTGQPPHAQPQQPPTPFAQAKFSADQWAEQLRNLSWNVPEVDKSRQSANTPPLRSPKKQARSGTKVRSTPQPATVATEAEEARETINSETPPEPSPSVPADAEAMDIDDELPPPPQPAAATMPGTGFTTTPGSASYPNLNAHGPQEHPATAQKSQRSRTEGSASNGETRNPLFDLDNLRHTAPFTTTNNGGIENLDDVHATLPFESRAKPQTTSKRDIRPRDLKLPNPPKRPKAPSPYSLPGSQQLILPRSKWNYYVSAMGTYMHEWHAFNRRILLHFNTRQAAIETGLSPGWISAVGDSARLKVNGHDDEVDDETGASGVREDTDTADADEHLVPGNAKGGFSAYLRGIEEDMQVRKHWEVACEMHRECVLDLGRLREWIRNGGKVI